MEWNFLKCLLEHGLKGDRRAPELISWLVQALVSKVEQLRSKQLGLSVPPNREIRFPQTTRRLGVSRVGGGGSGEVVLLCSPLIGMALGI